MRLALTLNNATAIPYVTQEEAELLAHVELHRLLALLQSLDEAEWGKPTACVRWSVRDMTAHQAAAYASGTGYGELLRQYTAALRPGRLPEDSINERQLADRAHKLPAELIAALKEAGEPATRTWARGFRFFKLFGMPHPTGWLSVKHLMLVVHSRDTWIHRLDICRATGRPFEQTSEHDGRITALVVLDLARALASKLGGQAITLELEGVAGGSWRIGRSEASAAIRMDTLDFHNLASGRVTTREALRNGALSGDRALAERALAAFTVLY